MKNGLMLLSLLFLYIPSLSATKGNKVRLYSKDREKSEALWAATGCIAAGALTGIGALAVGSSYTLLGAFVWTMAAPCIVIQGEPTSKKTKLKQD